jgi:hypothetical protein
VLRIIYTLAARGLRARRDPVFAVMRTTNAAIDALVSSNAGKRMVRPRQAAREL